MTARNCFGRCYFAFFNKKGLRVFVCETRTFFTGGADAHAVALEKIKDASFNLIKYETIEVI